MRVAILTETFAKKMGYMGNMLPRHLSRLGAEVHVVTLDLPPYHQIKDFQETYDGFTAKGGLVPGTVEPYDGYTLHVLPHTRLLGYMRMVGLEKKLRVLRPDVVYSLACIGWIALDAARIKIRLKYKLFTGSHTTASVFPLARRESPAYDPERIRSFLTRAVPGRFVSLFTEKCYGATEDCADIAVRFFGVQKNKVVFRPLGVDTELFTPVRDEEGRLSRLEVRERLGFTPSEIVCIYTGRFAEDKNPLALARAIERLAGTGMPYRGLFVGHGAQAEAIKAMRGCVVHPFVPVEELPSFYRASDIGVWPTQESTSMLDAAACGLPLIVNDTLIAVERIEGNGITYRLNDVDDLIRALLALRDSGARRNLGEVGARRMVEEFSWTILAKRRLDDFEAALA